MGRRRDLLRPAEVDPRCGHATDLSAKDHWLKIYCPKGAIIALVVAAVPPLLWSLGALRNRESARKRGGLPRRSLSQGNTAPTRIMISAIAAAGLLYQVISLLVCTGTGDHLDDLGPGPWLLVTGRVQGRSPWKKNPRRARGYAPAYPVGVRGARPRFREGAGQGSATSPGQETPPHEPPSRVYSPPQG